ncbi:hypothetical protein PSPO01_06499 [Paraphaeosphaeria sporulosa]
MSSPPPTHNPSSSSLARSLEPLRSNHLLETPTARASSGRDILVTLEEACQWFQLGYTILNPSTGEHVDIGPVPIPRYASGEGAFAREEESERKVRDAHAKAEAAKKGGSNGYSNGYSRGTGAGAAAT